MQIGLGIGTTFRQRWVPLSTEQIRSLLFGSGQQGTMYDPGNLNTLFQDAAGAVPVTAMEQPVGRILDISGNNNHAFQATTTKRPVLSRRVNLLEGTEPRYLGESFDFEAADIPLPPGVNAGTKITSRTVPSVTASPFIATSDSIRGSIMFHEGNISTRSILFYNMSRSENGPMVTLDLTTGITYGPGTAEPVGNGWWKLTLDWINGVSAGELIGFYRGSGGWDSTFGTYWYIAEPTVVSITDAHLPYQRVNTATDYDADPAKFPAYLRFDGVDDALQTNAIDFTGTDKMTVWAGITKLSDAANGMVYEFGSPESVNSGTFSMWAPINFASAPLGVTAKGIFRSVAATTTFSGASSGVVAQDINLSAPHNALRLNGATLRTLTTALGGSFGNFPFHIGARSGTPPHFNGRLYSLIVRGAQSSLSQIEATELYIKQKMRMP